MRNEDWKILERFGISKNNLTLGGYLYLENTSIQSLPDNLTVGGYLDLENTSIQSLPDNLTVGGSLYLENTSIQENPKVNRKKPALFSWKNGKYIKVDEIFCEVISRKGLVWKVKKQNTEKVFYIVSDGNDNYSHGYSIKEAKEDLIFKISNRSKEDYKGLNLDSKLKFDEAVKCYRVITGACQFGIKNFLNQKEIKRKTFKISEIIKLTENEYGGATFKQFFTA